MVVALTKIAPELWARWIELYALLPDRGWRGDPVKGLEYGKNLLLEARRDPLFARINPLLHELARLRTQMLEALVAAGMAEKISGSFLSDDMRVSPLLPAHWTAFSAGALGHLNELLDLVEDRLILFAWDRSEHVLYGVDIVVPSTEAQTSLPPKDRPKVQRAGRGIDDRAPLRILKKHAASKKVATGSVCPLACGQQAAVAGTPNMRQPGSLISPSLTLL
jgi:hypothetical protein